MTLRTYHYLTRRYSLEGMDDEAIEGEVDSELRIFLSGEEQCELVSLETNILPGFDSENYGIVPRQIVSILVVCFDEDDSTDIGPDI